MLNRNQVIDLAEEVGLVFNTHILPEGQKVTSRHGAALWKFYKLLKAEFEKELEIKEGEQDEKDN